MVLVGVENIGGLIGNNDMCENVFINLGVCNGEDENKEICVDGDWDVLICRKVVGML